MNPDEKKPCSSPWSKHGGKSWNPLYTNRWCHPLPWSFQGVQCVYNCIYATNCNNIFQRRSHWTLWVSGTSRWCGLTAAVVPAKSAWRSEDCEKSSARSFWTLGNQVIPWKIVKKLHKARKRDETTQSKLPNPNQPPSNPYNWKDSRSSNPWLGCDDTQTVTSACASLTTMVFSTIILYSGPQIDRNGFQYIFSGDRGSTFLSIWGSI